MQDQLSLELGWYLMLRRVRNLTARDQMLYNIGTFLQMAHRMRSILNEHHCDKGVGVDTDLNAEALWGDEG